MKFYLHPVFIFTALLFFASCKDGDKNDKPEDNSANESSVKNISFSIIKSYPHDTSSFTQGLVVYKGRLYEGTGGADYGPVGSKTSHLLKVDLQTGKAEKSIQLPGKYFGEGITILNDTVYQLTWKEHTVLVYTLPDFKKVKEFPLNTEGWGITHDGKELIVSDGTSNLYYYEPSTFKLLRTQSVTQNENYVGSLNELEFINGFIYANQWQQPYIFKIDPSSGMAIGRIDLTEVWNRIKAIDPDADVPNGIAYDADTKKIYITGKKWPELYEVQFGE